MALLFWTDFFYTKLTESYYEELRDTTKNINWVLYLYPFDVKKQWNGVQGNAAGRKTDAVPVIICETKDPG